jgi:hypothetical protein
MPGEGAAAMSSRLQSIPNSTAAIVHQLMPKPISSQVPDPEKGAGDGARLGR